MKNTSKTVTLTLDDGCGQAVVPIDKIVKIEEHASFVTVNLRGGGLLHCDMDERAQAAIMRAKADVLEERARAADRAGGLIK